MFDTLRPTPEQKFRKGFFKDAAKRVGGVAVGVHVNTALSKPVEARQTRVAARIDHLAGRKLQVDRSHEYSRIFEEQPALLDKIRSAYREAAFWHGTGRYQQQADGTPVDILRGILEQGSIQPRYDLYNPDDGTKTSVSMAYSRMYSRICAEAYYPKGKGLENSFGSVHFWAGLFGVSNGVEQLRDREHRARLSSPRKLEEIKVHNAKRLARRGMEDGATGLGSTIEGNYPILFGIKEGAFEAADTAQWMRKHEARTLEPIPVRGLSHVEVPLEYVEVTQALFSQYGYADFPVLPIEAGEEYVSHFTVSRLANGEKLSS